MSQLNFYNAFFCNQKRRRAIKLVTIFSLASLTLIAPLQLFAVEEQLKNLRAQALGAFALATLETDPTLSFRLAEQSLYIKPTYWGQKALWSAYVHPLYNSLIGHTDSVFTASFSPDGTRILTDANDNTARVWDARTGKLLATLGHTAVGGQTSFSPDGTRILTVANDRTARVWDARTGAVLATLTGDTGHIYSATFSPDGTRIVTALSDETVRVWPGNYKVILKAINFDKVRGTIRQLTKQEKSLYGVQ